jgi:hypothetical protein
MTHWRQLTNPDYFGSHDLFETDNQYREIVVTLKSVQKVAVMGADGKKSDCIVATTNETKPIILNKTNCKTITRLLGTPATEKWAGQQVKIGVDKVKAFGDVTDALRVRNEKVSQKAPQDYSKQLEAIRTAKDLTELQTIWKTLDNEGQAVCLAVKDERKSQLNTK